MQFFVETVFSSIQKNFFSSYLNVRKVKSFKFGFAFAEMLFLEDVIFFREFHET